MDQETLDRDLFSKLLSLKLSIQVPYYEENPSSTSCCLSPHIQHELKDCAETEWEVEDWILCTWGMGWRGRLAEHNSKLSPGH